MENQINDLFIYFWHVWSSVVTALLLGFDKELIWIHPSDQPLEFDGSIFSRINPCNPDRRRQLRSIRWHRSTHV